MVFKPQVKDLSRGHAQGQRAKGVDKEARHQSCQPLGVVRFDAQHRAAPLQAQRARHQLLAGVLSPHQPAAKLTRPRRSLRRQRRAQILRRNPALLKHHQAERNAVPVTLLRPAPPIHLPAERRGHPLPRARLRAAPPALEDRRLPAAPKAQPAGAAAGIRAGGKDCGVQSRLGACPGASTV